MSIINVELEKTLFELLDLIEKDHFMRSYEEMELIQDPLVFKEAAIAMIPEGKRRLRKYQFLNNTSCEDFAIIFNEYYCDSLLKF